MTSAPTAEALTETIDHAVTTAGLLKSDAAWLWMDAYWPAGQNRDRPTRLRPRPDPGVDPDHVPGERLALGVGNDAARAAYTRAATLVTDAHRLACIARAHYTGIRPPVGNRQPARGTHFPLIVDDVTRKLRWLADRDVAHAPDDVRRVAHAAADALLQAHGALRAVLRDVAGTGLTPADRRCSNCGELCTDQQRRECWKCIHYRLRHKGQARPVRRNADAVSAKRRRVERGEDQAADPPPRGRYVDGQWTPATPHPDLPAEHQAAR